MRQNPVLNFLEKLGKSGEISTSDAILVAVSGGADSVALARWTAATGQKMAIAHVNFGLRGAESDGDEAFVKALSGELGVDFFVKKMPASEFAAKNKISIQMAARQLRYDYFEKIRIKFGFRYIAIAHHLDDSKETAMLNFFRGTGVRGLRGILPKKEAIIRPLLRVTKAEILGEFEENVFFQTQNPPFREDSSNKKNDYARNFLRNDLVPNFEKINTGFWSKVMPAQLERMRDLDILVEKLTQNLIKKSVQTIDNQVVISISEILKSDAPRYFLGEILLKYGFNQTQIFDLFENIGGQSGRQFFSETHWLLQNRGELLLTNFEIKSESTDYEILIQENDGEIDFSEGKILFFAAVQNDFPDNLQAIFQKNALLFPLKIRKWRTGDWFCPSGMGGRRKKLSDYFTDLKLSRVEKEKVLILENAAGEILWIIGFRTDERAISATFEDSILIKFELK
jgi:tRNA(Ile)-lysidine synthase